MRRYAVNGLEIRTEGQMVTGKIEYASFMSASILSIRWE